MNYISNTSLESYIRQFDLKHSELGEPVRDGNTLLFPDGAYRECSVYGLQVEPSRDKVQRLQTIVQYWQAKYDHAVSEAREAFRQVRALAEVAEKWGESAPPGQAAIDHVAALKKTADDILPHLEKAIAEFDAVRPRGYEGDSGLKARAIGVIQQLNDFRM